MQMLYNSENYVVVQFDLATADDEGGDQAKEFPRGGYEIVDKFAGKEIYIEGAMAQSFREGVDALIHSGTSEDAMDEYIGRYGSLMQHPVVLH